MINLSSGKNCLKNLLSGPFTTIFASVLTTFLIAAFFFKFAGPVPVSVSQTSVEKQSSFDVTGEGQVTSIPDEAKVSLGISVEKSTVTSAQKEINQIINSIIDALKDKGIKKEDIKTINYSVNPRYDYRQDRQITGYLANATIQVTFKDFDKLNEAIDSATSLGANQVGNIQFTLSEEKEKELQKETRKIAINQAKEKAEELAKLSGIKLGKIINVTESFNQPYIRPVYMKDMAVGSAEEESTQVEPGSTQLTVSIILSYETL